jgi:hypothetical protein
LGSPMSGFWNRVLVREREKILAYERISHMSILKL